MKPGTPIPGLDFMKKDDDDDDGKGDGEEGGGAVALRRDEYPDWVNKLSERDVTLAQLRRMDENNATDRQKVRYLKLTRRANIKEKNFENAKS